jgi:hypothetical protein
MLNLSTVTSNFSSEYLRPIPRLGLLLFCLISFGLSAHQTLGYFTRGPAFTDFRIFMTGIDIVKAGNGHDLYKFRTQNVAQVKLYPETRVSGMLPFNHLAYELLFYWPLSYLPYHSALIVWALLNTGLICLIAWLLGPYTMAIRQVTGLPIVLFLIAAYPVIYVLGEGQDSLLFLLFVVLSFRAMNSERPFLAGLLLALGCFKIHLALLIAFFVLLLPRKWKGVAGFATGSASVAGISLLMVGPNVISDYLYMLKNQDMMTPWGFIPWFMPNLRGFFRWTLRHWLDVGQILPVVFMASAIVGIVATWLVLRTPDSRDSGPLYSVAIVSTILISYHLHMQDLAMVMLPMLLLTEWALGNYLAGKKLSLGWVLALSASVAGIYLYRIAVEPYPLLIMLACYLTIPLFLLWIVAFRIFCEGTAGSSGAAWNNSSGVPTFQTGD